MLYFNKQIPRLCENRQAKKWEKFEMSTLRGCTVGFLGYGDIAKKTASLCPFFGMNIYAFKKSIGDIDRTDLGENVWSSSESDGKRAFASKCDFVVCSLPGTQETRHFCNSEFFSLVKPSGIFISIGRGSVVDEKALIDALESKIIAGAVLDVFETEPLPQESQLWKFGNCLISSHNADWTETYFNDSVEIFFKNLELFLAGDKLANVVNLEKGY
jgi:D-2-hydroxyacid dehydrogenase (NADP+)